MDDTNGVCAPVQVVGCRALSMLDQFKEQELSNVVWAFAKLHHYDSEMFKQLLQAVTNKLPHFLPQVCGATCPACKVSWTCWHLGWRVCQCPWRPAEHRHQVYAPAAGFSLDLVEGCVSVG
mgnify:CR=1 FL=1